MKHYSVLLKETIDSLQIKNDGVYVDATLGYGGHSSHILEKLTTGTLYAFDKDEEAIKYSTERLSKINHHFQIIHSDFGQMKEKLAEFGITEVDGIVFDLGVSSPQIDEAERGFSFMNDAPLDMRMDKSQSFDAMQVVNEYSFEDLRDLFFQYGEESKSKFIAAEIVATRAHKRIETTKELVLVIRKAVGEKYFLQKHPERQIFQAIRIEVNNELNTLETVLPEAIDLLKTGGRISVITFHSLEDRIVKRIFKKYSEVNEMVKGLPEIPLEYKPSIRLVNKKPIVATNEELDGNRRSKSAKLRVIERI